MPFTCPLSFTYTVGRRDGDSFKTVPRFLFGMSFRRCPSCEESVVLGESSSLEKMFFQKENIEA
jgi:hypothetical protein